MTSKEFRAFQKENLERFNHILASHPKGACDEQGLPSYTNPNPLMRWLVWKRVEVLFSIINSLDLQKSSVLDFGCGYGLFLPLLAEKSKRIIAFDLDVKELSKMGESSGWKNIIYLDDYYQLASMGNYFDLILASEVLEHVSDLENKIVDFSKLLTPKGILLVSGPSENILYKFGRKLAGYSGEYHERNIYQIKEMLTKYFKIEPAVIIIPIMPFYEILICRRKY